jgi:plasmid stabilization system protein ParE
MVREAQARALRAEELIVAFKGLLADLPELGAPERRLEAVHFRERLVTECIRAYYAR